MTSNRVSASVEVVLEDPEEDNTVKNQEVTTREVLSEKKGNNMTMTIAKNMAREEEEAVEDPREVETTEVVPIGSKEMKERTEGTSEIETASQEEEAAEEEEIEEIEELQEAGTTDLEEMYPKSIWEIGLTMMNGVESEPSRTLPSNRESGSQQTILNILTEC